MTTKHKSAFMRFMTAALEVLERDAVETAGMSREQMITHYLAKGRDRFELEVMIDELMESRDKILAKRAARGNARPMYERIATMTQEELERFTCARGWDLEELEALFRQALVKAADEERATGDKASPRSIDELSPAEQVRLLARAQERREAEEDAEFDRMLASPEERDALFRAHGIDPEENRRTIRRVLEESEAEERDRGKDGDPIHGPWSKDA